MAVEVASAVEIMDEVVEDGRDGGDGGDNGDGGGENIRG